MLVVVCEICLRFFCAVILSEDKFGSEGNMQSFVNCL